MDDDQSITEGQQEELHSQKRSQFITGITVPMPAKPEQAGSEILYDNIEDIGENGKHHQTTTYQMYGKNMSPEEVDHYFDQHGKKKDAYMKNPKKIGANNWDPKDIDANSTDTKEKGPKQEIDFGENMGYIFENEEDPQWKRKAKVKTKIVEFHNSKKTRIGIVKNFIVASPNFNRCPANSVGAYPDCQCIQLDDYPWQYRYHDAFSVCIPDDGSFIGNPILWFCILVTLKSIISHLLMTTCYRDVRQEKRSIRKLTKRIRGFALFYFLFGFGCYFSQGIHRNYTSPTFLMGVFGLLGVLLTLYTGKYGYFGYYIYYFLCDIEMAIGIIFASICVFDPAIACSLLETPNRTCIDNVHWLGFVSLIARFIFSFSIHEIHVCALKMKFRQLRMNAEHNL